MVRLIPPSPNSPAVPLPPKGGAGNFGPGNPHNGEFRGISGLKNKQYLPLEGTPKFPFCPVSGKKGGRP
jgi:hypothetical protein